MFTLLVFGLLLYALLRTGVLVDLSDNVLLLLGVVGAGSTAVLLTVPARDRLSAVNVKWMRDRKWLGMAPRSSELITDGEDIAIERVQSLAFTLVVFFFMLLQGGTKLASFAIPQGILGILAASQAIFVAGRAVRAGTAGQAPTAGMVPGDDKRLDELITDARIKWTLMQADKEPAKKQQLQTVYEAAAKLASQKLLERLNLSVDSTYLSS
jgi:hypothetical protein